MWSQCEEIQPIGADRAFIRKHSVSIYTEDKIHTRENVRQYFWREKNGFIKITQKKIKSHESTLNVKKLLESCPHQKIPFFFVK